MAKRMVEIVEAIPISGDAFPIRSFENKFKFVATIVVIDVVS